MTGAPVTGAPRSVLRTAGLTKDYPGHTALTGVNLDVAEGSVYGLVGPNGAGKTTLLAILAGLRRPTSGRIDLDVPRDRRALLPDTPQFDPWLTGHEVVALAGHLAGLRGADLSSRTERALDEAGLSDAAGRRAGGYSRGMLQRLGVAATVVGDPELLLLDEPASALDPAGRREVLDLIAGLRGRATVVLSSHILADVQEVCDTVGILRDGRLLFQGPLEKLLVGRAVPAYRVHLRSGADAAIAALRAQEWVAGVDRTAGPESATGTTGPAGTADVAGLVGAVGAAAGATAAGKGDDGDPPGGWLRITVRSLDEAEARLTGVLAAAGAAVISLAPEAADLEDVFLELTS